MHAARRNAHAPKPTSPLLGIEGGGTRTRFVLAPAPEAAPLVEGELGPANARLITDRDLYRLFRRIAAALPTAPLAVGMGLAGVRSESDRSRVRGIAARVWPATPIQVTHDLETAWRAARHHPDHPALLVIAGTGSCCYGRLTDGQEVRVGGWGHVLGDVGSGYDLALRALRRTVFDHDRHDRWGPLGESILSRLLLNHPEQLIHWAQNASKSDIASIVPAVFAAADKGDRTARTVIHETATALASDAAIAARRLAAPNVPVDVLVSGGLLDHPSAFLRRFTRELRSRRPAARVRVVERSGAHGALALAAEIAPATPVSHPTAPTPPAKPPARWIDQVVTATDLSPTELRHPDSTQLDRMPTDDAIRLMLREDAKIPGILADWIPTIRRLVHATARSLESGGRLFYVGAGTSGRLGILDASECPPTFRTPPEWVQGIIAGGREAIWRAVEGAEDDHEAGSEAIRFHGVTRLDTVVGIAASGRTPFVHGALREARGRGATTALIAFNPNLRWRRGQRPDIVLTPATGPELLTGSTRLKSGTATKLILNIVTTLAMVRIGKVIGNLMVDVHPSNDKLKLRAVRILRELTNLDETAARTLLTEHDWVIRNAWNHFTRSTS